MKTWSFRVILFGVFIFSALAQTAPPAPPVPDQAAAAELAALEQFLGLSDAELAQMQQVIARIRAMKPEERAAMREQIAAFRRLPDEQRAQLRQGWGWMPPEIQAGWREMMQSATPERRTQIQAKMQSLPPDEKAEYRRAVVEEFLREKAARK